MRTAGSRKESGRFSDRSMLWLCVLPVLLAVRNVEADGPAQKAAERVGVALPELVQMAVSANPDVAAARAAWGAAVEQIPQARALPDPMVRFDYFGENVETRVGPQEYRYGVSQQFPFPGTLKQAGKVAAGEAGIRRAEYERVVRDLIVDVTVSYHELRYLRGAEKLTRRNEELLRHILKLSEAAHAEDRATLSDVLKAQSQLAQLGYDLVLLQELEDVETAKLNTLMDRSPRTAIGELRTPPRLGLGLSLEQLDKLALTERQEVEMAAHAEEKARAGIKLAKLKNRPRFTLGATRIETGPADMDVSDSGKDPWLVGVGVTIPLWIDRNRSRVRQAELQLENASAKRRALENRTRSDLHTLYFRLQNARRLVELYEKTLIPQAEKAMSAAEDWHDGEPADVSGFLETQSVWLNFKLARLRAVTDCRQHLARLERLVGATVSSPPADGENDQ